MNNKSLFIVLVALVGVFILSKFLKGDRTRSFDPVIMEVDTALVDRIEITRKAQPNEMVVLSREATGWTVSNGNISADAPDANVTPTLSAISRIEAQRIVARSSDKWSEYEVGDDASRIKVFVKGKQAGDLVIGGFKFDQAKRSASTYVRKAEQEEVYLVEGFLAMQLTQGMDAYRNNIILTSDPGNITRIEYDHNDDVTVITKDMDGTWYFAGMEAIDSTAMAGYLNGIKTVISRDFASVTRQADAATGSLRFSGNNMSPIEITLFDAQSESDRPFLIQSSLNPESYFASDSTGIYEKLFGNLNQLLLEM